MIPFVRLTRILLASLFVCSFITVARADDYPIEATYAATGPFKTVQTEIQDYQIFYPAEMRGDHPLITWGNSAGGVPRLYAALLNHFASWGFVVVATNSQASNAELLISGVDLMASLNANPDSVFFNQIRLDVVAAAGHSLGASAALSAGGLDERIQVVCSGNPGFGNIEMSEGAVLLMTGSEDPWSNVVDEIYEGSDVPTVFGILQGAPHFAFMGNGTGMRGYATAWLMAHMQNDHYASGAFYGDAEMSSHVDWVVQSKNLEDATPPEDTGFNSYISDPAFGLEPSEQGLKDDPDFDRLPNGVEAFFGTHPGEANHTNVISLTIDAGEIVFTHPQVENPPSDLSIFYEWTVDLVNWFAGDGMEGPSDGPKVTLTPTTEGSITTVTIDVAGNDSRIFVRTGVTQN